MQAVATHLIAVERTVAAGHQGARPDDALHSQRHIPSDPLKEVRATNGAVSPCVPKEALTYALPVGA